MKSMLTDHADAAGVDAAIAAAAATVNRTPLAPLFQSPVQQPEVANLMWQMLQMFATQMTMSTWPAQSGGASQPSWMMSPAGTVEREPMPSVSTAVVPIEQASNVLELRHYRNGISFRRFIHTNWARDFFREFGDSMFNSSVRASAGRSRNTRVANARGLLNGASMHIVTSMKADSEHALVWPDCGTKKYNSEDGVALKASVCARVVLSSNDLLMPPWVFCADVNASMQKRVLDSYQRLIAYAVGVMSVTEHFMHSNVIWAARIDAALSIAAADVNRQRIVATSRATALAVSKLIGSENALGAQMWAVLALKYRLRTSFRRFIRDLNRETSPPLATLLRAIWLYLCSYTMASVRPGASAFSIGKSGEGQYDILYVARTSECEESVIISSRVNQKNHTLYQHYTNADESMLLWLVRQVVAHAEYKPGVTLIASDDNVSGLLQKSVNELLRRDDEEAFVIPEAVLKGRRK